MLCMFCCSLHVWWKKMSKYQLHLMSLDFLTVYNPVQYSELSSKVLQIHFLDGICLVMVNPPALCFIIQLQILSIIPSSRCVCSAQSSEEGRLNLLKTLIIGLSPWIPITHPPSMSKSEHASTRAVRLTLLFSIRHMLNIQNQCRISSQSYNISITT